MEPLIRIEAKTPNPASSDKDSGVSPINSTASASWLLAALDEHRDVQPNEPAGQKVVIESYPPVFTSTLSVLSKSSSSRNLSHEQQDLNLTKNGLSGLREVM
jgi:hypothetical protein